VEAYDLQMEMDKLFRAAKSKANQTNLNKKFDDRLNSSSSNTDEGS
jgi:hypothetical protein